MEAGITSDPRKEAVVKDLNCETTRDCSLQTMFSTSSSAYKVKTSAKKPSVFDGNGTKRDAAPSCPKRAGRKTSFVKMGLRNQEGICGSNGMRGDEMNKLQKMLSQTKALSSRFSERSLYHLPSHFVGCDNPLLQRSPFAGLHLVTSSSRGQIEDNHYSPELHKNVNQNEVMASWPSLPISMDRSDLVSCYPTSRPPSAPNTPVFLFEKKTSDTSNTLQTQESAGSDLVKSTIPEVGNPTSSDKDRSQSTNFPSRKTVFKVKRLPALRYPQQSKLGLQQITKWTYPSYTIGQSIHAHPAPPSPVYNIVLADRLVLQTSAAYSIGQRLPGIHKRTGSTPAPCAYDVDRAFPIIRHCCPSYTIRGMRREKRHDLGPFTTF